MTIMTGEGSAIFLADRRSPDEKLTEIRDSAINALSSVKGELDGLSKSPEIEVSLYFNTHLPGHLATRAVKAITEQTPRPIVLFQEYANLEDGSEIQQTLKSTQELALDLLTGNPDERPRPSYVLTEYFEQVAYGVGRAGIPTFPLDVRSGLKRTLEAIVNESLANHYRDKRLTRQALSSLDVKELVDIEIAEAKVASLLMEIRDTTAATQIGTYLLGLLSHSVDTFDHLGIDMTEAQYAIEIAARREEEDKLGVSVLYGSAHTGLFHTLLSLFPKEVRRHYLDPPGLDARTKDGPVWARQSYYKLGSNIGWATEQRTRALAAQAVLEDSLALMISDPGFINLMPTSPDSPRQILELAHKLTREHQGAEGATRYLHDNALAIEKRIVDLGIAVRI